MALVKVMTSSRLKHPCASDPSGGAHLYVRCLGSGPSLVIGSAAGYVRRKRSQLVQIW